MKGLFLVLEGLDGAGKSSQLLLLEEFFRRSGRKVRTIHFPQLENRPFGDMIASYLRGEFGDLQDVHPKLAALLYALDRQQAAPAIRTALQNGDVVLADRYLHSNLAYQRAKYTEMAEQDAIGDWIERLEYGSFSIPRPDLTLFLDTPLQFSLAQVAGERSGTDRSYLNGGEDIHENNASFQQRVRQQYLLLARRRVGEFATVDCSQAGRMADRAAIHSRIIDALRYYRIL